MKKISREDLGALFIGTIVLIANTAHILTEWVTNPKDRIFSGIAHYFADYFLYVSQIVQGSRGAWFYTFPVFTNEPGSPTWIYWLYTVIGKMAYLGIGPFTAYTISLLFFSALLLLLLWIVAGMAFPKHPRTRLVAFLFMTTASHIPGPGDFWFSPMPALNRLGGVPHQMFQTVLLMGVIILAVRGLTDYPKRNMYRLGLLAAVGFLAATANPMQMLLIVVSLGIGIIALHAFRTVSDTSEVAESKPANGLTLWLMIALPALLGALLTNAEFARQPILTAAKLWEDGQRIHVPLIRFLFAVGPIAILIPFGIRWSVTRSAPILRVMTLFGTLSFVMFFSPLPVLLQTSPVRWLSPAAYMMLPLIATAGWQELSGFFGRRTGRKHYAMIAGYLLLAGYMAATVPSFVSQISKRITPLRTDPLLVTLNHIPKPYMEILSSIHDASDGASDHPVTLTDPTLPLDVLVPIFTDTVSFTGHPIHTLYPQIKEQLRQRFFSGSMDEDEVRGFFRDHRIRFVLVSANASRVLPRYTVTKEIFRNATASVYEIHL